MARGWLIEINNVEHGQRIAAGRAYTPGLDTCISRSLNGKFLGGVIYQDYQLRSILIHVGSASPRWLSRDMLWAIFDYPFNQLKVEKIVGFVPTTNSHALAFDLKIGFTEETRIKDMVPGGDIAVISMYREQCRWLSIEPRLIGPTLPEVFR